MSGKRYPEEFKIEAVKQVTDRGYVLDQGKNAYTGTGRELLSDPKVIALYLGTLAKATGG